MKIKDKWRLPKRIPLRLKIASWLIGKNKFIKNVKVKSDNVFGLYNLKNCYIDKIEIHYTKITRAGIVMKNCSYNTIKKVVGFHIGGGK